MSTALRELIERVNGTAGSDVLVHCCAADPPIELLYGASARGVLVDLDRLRRTDWDAIGAALEAGRWVGLGAWPTDRTLTADDGPAGASGLRDLGLDPSRTLRLILTPACGLARPPGRRSAPRARPRPNRHRRALRAGGDPPDPARRAATHGRAELQPRVRHNEAVQIKQLRILSAVLLGFAIGQAGLGSGYLGGSGPGC